MMDAIFFMFSFYVTVLVLLGGAAAVVGICAVVADVIDYLHGKYKATYNKRDT